MMGKTRRRVSFVSMMGKARRREGAQDAEFNRLKHNLAEMKVKIKKNGVSELAFEQN